MARFPGPYLNDCNRDDPVMIRTKLDDTSIGANAVGLPKGGVNSDNMNIKHVGDQNGKGA